MGARAQHEARAREVTAGAYHGIVYRAQGGDQVGISGSGRLVILGPNQQRPNSTTDSMLDRAYRADSPSNPSCGYMALSGGNGWVFMCYLCSKMPRFG